MPRPDSTNPWPSCRGLVAILILLAIFVYANSLGAAFVFDDFQSIHENPFVTRPHPWWNAFRSPRETAVAGRPLASASLALNHALGQVDPFGYHFFNIAIHTLAGLTLFGLLRRTFALPIIAGRAEAPGCWSAGLIAALWIVHPIQTESVTYIVQRAESMAGLFYLLTLYCLLRAATTHGSRAWSLAAVLACAGGMASKEVMATAPLAALLYDRCFLAGTFREALRRRTGLYTGLAATWLILIGLMAAGPRSDSTGFGLVASLDQYLRWQGSQFPVLVHYLRLCFWPEPLVLDYGWPPIRNWFAILPHVALVAALLVATLAALIRRSLLAFPAAVFFLILAPTSSVVPILDRAFEHRMYLPLASVMTLVVLTGRRLLHAATHGRPPSKRSAVAATSVSLVIVAALAARTLVRNHDYRSGVILWIATVQSAPTNPRAWNNLCHCLVEENRPLEARDAGQRAVDLDPLYANAHWNLANVYHRLNQVPEALFHGRRAVELDPDHPVALNNYAVALLADNRPEEAIPHLRRARDLNSNLPQPLTTLVAALCRSGRMEEAIAAGRAAVAQLPDSAIAHANLGVALAGAGHVDEARAAYEAALRLDPADETNALNLGLLAAQIGSLDVAERWFRMVLEIDSRNTAARVELAAVRSRQGATAEAMQLCREALSADPQNAAARRKLADLIGALGAAATTTQRVERAELTPDNPDAHYNLAIALAREVRHAEAVAAYRRALELRPDWDRALNNLAMLLAESTDPAVRNPAEAVRLAERACASPAGARPEALDTLAAAYAAAGRLNDALDAAKRGLDLARLQNAADLVAELEKRLADIRTRMAQPTSAPRHTPPH